MPAGDRTLQQLDSKIKLNHNKIADKILADHKIIYSAGEYYEYRDSFYQTIAEDTIACYIKSILNDKFSVRFKNEVLNSLRASCYIDHQLLNNTQYLNLKNGLFDIETENLVPHSPDIYSTIQLAVSYNRESKCPLWIKSVSEIFENSASKAAILQEYFGLCLTKEVRYCKALFMLGEGRNGKSTVLYILENIVGEQNKCSIPLDKLSDFHYVANLLNKLVNISIETNSKAEVYDAMFKSITSGDSVTADPKYRNPFTFRPYCKLIYALNNMPRVNDKTDAYFRRLLILKFNKQFSGIDDNKGLKDELMREIDGIFLWCLEGYRRLKERGDFSIGEDIQTEINEHRKENNNVIVFVEEECERDTWNQVSKDELYQAYKRWCHENSHQSLSKIRFGKELVRQYKLGSDRSTSGDDRIWIGIDVKLKFQKASYAETDKNDRNF